MADKISDFIAARARAIEAAEAAKPHFEAAERAIAQAEELGRAAGIKVSMIREGLPSLTYSLKLPHTEAGG